MNEEIFKQVLESARKIFIKNRELMDKHCEVVRTSIKDLEVLRIDSNALPSIYKLGRAIVTMEMVFEMKKMLPKAKECVSLTKYLVSKGE